jgi:hypothetical protein
VEVIFRLIWDFFEPQVRIWSASYLNTVPVDLGRVVYQGDFNSDITRKSNSGLLLGCKHGPPCLVPGYEEFRISSAAWSCLFWLDKTLIFLGSRKIRESLKNQDVDGIILMLPHLFAEGHHLICIPRLIFLSYEFDRSVMQLV